MLNARAGTLAQFHLRLGDILVELYDADKPVTVSNFINYVHSGRYQDMFLHRWEHGFVVQGGGFWITNRQTANAQFAAVQTFGDITNEYNTGHIYSNLYGTIAMARVGGQTNSASSQWFFNLGTNSFLDTVDGGFTVFGHVVAGTNTLDHFNTGQGLWFDNSLQDPLSELPVLSPTPTFEDLVYADISLPSPVKLQIHVGTDGARALSWNSLSNLVHNLEFAPSLKASWQTLVSTNGTGATIEVKDLTPAISERFYRVRVQ